MRTYKLKCFSAFQYNTTVKHNSIAKTEDDRFSAFQYNTTVKQAC